MRLSLPRRRGSAPYRRLSSFSLRSEPNLIGIKARKRKNPRQGMSFQADSVSGGAAVSGSLHYDAPA
jgi:hypothetical protein